jgi:hypothetical protein
MDMYEAARLEEALRERIYNQARQTAMEARYEGGVLAAGIAIAELRKLLPTAASAAFLEPQEPGSTASMDRVFGPADEVLYDAEEGFDPADVEDDLTVVTDFLTGALEDGVQFSRSVGYLWLDLSR